MYSLVRAMLSYSALVLTNEIPWAIFTLTRYFFATSAATAYASATSAGAVGYPPVEGISAPKSALSKDNVLKAAMPGGCHAELCFGPIQRVTPGASTSSLSEKVAVYPRAFLNRQERPSQ
jgi:hypothetical protein